VGIVYRAFKSIETLNKTKITPDDHEGRKIEIVWHKALEDLMCEEAEKCAGLAWMHTKSEMVYSNYNNWLSIPSIVMSTILGAASIGLTTIFPMSVTLASSVIGVLNILVSMMGILNSHFDFAKRSNGHKMGAVQYAQMHRMIHIEMSLPRDQRMAPKILLRYVRDDLKRLMEVLPRVPDVVIAKYKKEIIPSASNVSHPEITNGIHPVVVYTNHNSAEIESPKTAFRSKRHLDIVEPFQPHKEHVKDHLKEHLKEHKEPPKEPKEPQKPPLVKFG